MFSISGRMESEKEREREREKEGGRVEWDAEVTVIGTLTIPTMFLTAFKPQGGEGQGRWEGRESGETGARDRSERQAREKRGLVACTQDIQIGRASCRERV